MHTKRIAHVARNSTALSVLLALCLGLFSACNRNDNNTPQLQTINDLVNSNTQFTLLRAAIARAGLAGTLSGAGPFTVFAPTDDAFRAAGFGDVNAINSLNSLVVAQILQYHVLGSRVESGAIQTAVNTAVPTLAVNASNQALPIYVTKTASGSVSVNGARVIEANRAASNGVIHVIDRVMIPPLLGDIPTTLQGIPNLFPAYTFNLLIAAATRANLGGVLSAAGPFTVFAPTDAAFAAANPSLGTVAAINATPVADLTRILTYHVVSGQRAYSPLLTNGASVTTVQGGTVTIGVSTTGVTATGRGNGGTASRVVAPDISASNGVIHIIDRVLLP